MTLAQYLLAHSISQADFAARLGTTDATVSRWVAGKMVPRREMMMRVERMTDGAVRPGSWFTVPDDTGANNHRDAPRASGVSRGDAA